MRIGLSKNQERKRKLRKIRKGWHDYFAWLPVRLEDGGLGFFETVERKFYVASPSAVVKKGLNESEFSYWQNLEVMYRSKGSNAEKTVYYRRNGSPYADPNEVMSNISEDRWNQISNQLDSLEE